MRCADALSRREQLGKTLHCVAGSKLEAALVANALKLSKTAAAGDRVWLL